MFCCNSWCLPESCSNLFFFGSNYILFVVLVNTLVLTKILKSEIFKNHIIKWKGKECIKARSISAPLWMWCQSITSFSSDFSDNCRQKKNSTEFLLKLLDLKSDFTLTLGYLSPSLNRIQSTRRRTNSPMPTRRRIKSSRDVGELVVNPIQLIRS